MRLRSWWLGGVAVMVLAFASEAAADLQWLGVHGSYYELYDRGAIGLNAREELGNHLSAGLRGDYIFRNGTVTWAFDVDLQYDLPLNLKRPLFWVGGGGGIVHDDPNVLKHADVRPTATGFVGAGYKTGPLLPYLELRLTSQENARLVVTMGLRF
jgi:hypothetical protein